MANNPAKTFPEDAALIEAAILATGRTTRSFAQHVLLRDPRRVGRWLAGQEALPEIVRERCQEIVAAAQAARPTGLSDSSSGSNNSRTRNKGGSSP